MSRDPDRPAGKVISLFGGPAPAPLPPEEPAPATSLVTEVPEPPRFHDPRQLRSRSIIRSTTAQSGRRSAGAVVNIESGFGAAGVNVGELQDMLERMISGLDAKQLLVRWEADIDPLFTEALFGWVQRIKELELMVEDDGVRVELVTQDDHGEYAYRFDVFPGREF